jgi:trimeric autotransporter adhesin
MTKNPIAPITLTLLVANASGQPCQPEWSPLGKGLNDAALALAVFDDGSGPALYAAGAFTAAAGQPVGRIARWDGAAWSKVGTGDGADKNIYVLQTFDDGSGPTLYAFGSFTTVDGVPAAGAARWDGQAWSQAGDGLTGLKNTAAVFDDGTGAALFVGGRTLKGQDQQYAARLDGDAWTPLTGLNGWFNHFCPIDSVFALQTFDDGSGSALYAGGRFDWVNDVQSYDAARWNGTAWEAIGLDDECSAILCFAVLDDGNGPALIASLPGKEMLRRWDGVHWQEIPGSRPDTSIRVLLAHDDRSGPALFAGMEAEDGMFSGIARWDGSAWDGLGGGLGGQDARAIELASFQGALYVAGSFDTAGGKPAANIARWGCPACQADCTADGALDFFDFVCFISLFNAADPAADCDGSDGLDVFDFLCFVNAFNEGC